MSDTIRIDARGVSINGRREVLLCASLFYFRIPEGSWQDRMGKIRDAGYNCIDVYFPWNFHETERDSWDFGTGMRDIDGFLELAARNDLYVMARPGPYICSEWDGGSLPAYLFADGIAIRQNDRRFLDRVQEWYERVLPIIGNREIGRNGSVIVLQIENELDFFACNDVPGYIAALKRIARACGITVPVIACAGQADLYGAWGEVPDVIPTMNLYLDSRMPGLETAVTEYTRILAQLDVPLMVTEMGRDNLLMRRFLASGAKLIGPYNQVSGFDFGFTNSVNNWGSPTSFQTSYYDFSSLITPFGEVRDFVVDDRVLAGLLRSLGPMLAWAVPLAADAAQAPFRMSSTEGQTSTPSVLQLDGPDAGYLIAVSNLSDQERTFTVEQGNVSESLRLPAGVSAFALFGVDLTQVGVPVRIDASTAEPVLIVTGDDPVVVWQAPIDGTVVLTAGGRTHRFTFTADAELRDSVELPDGRTLTLYGIGRARAGVLVGHDTDGLRFREAPATPKPQPIGYSLRASRTTNAGVFDHGRSCTPRGDSIELEKNGFLRGYGLYQLSGVLERPVGAVLHGAGDVVSLYRGGRYVATRYPSGACEFVEFRDAVGGSPEPYEVRAEIWGHSNFDDSRKPALRISSLRGLSGVTEVRAVRPLPTWHAVRSGRGRLPYITGLGRNLTTDRPAVSVWETTLPVDERDDAVLLRFDGIACEIDIAVNGQRAGRVDQFATILDVSPLIRTGLTTITATVHKRHFEESAGTVSVLMGSRLPVGELRGIGETELDTAAATARGEAVACELPLSLEPGEVTWLYLTNIRPDLRTDAKIKIAGRNCKATVLYSGRVCGRLFTDSEGGPVMRPGQPGVGYLPAGWVRAVDRDAAILVEAVGTDGATVESISIEPVG